MAVQRSAVKPVSAAFFAILSLSPLHDLTKPRIFFTFRSRALQQAFAGGGRGAPAVGRGRGRGLTVPSWLTNPGMPGGLQESGNGSRYCRTVFEKAGMLEERSGAGHAWSFPCSVIVIIAVLVVAKLSVVM